MEHLGGGFDGSGCAGFGRLGEVDEVGKGGGGCCWSVVVVDMARCDGDCWGRCRICS